MYTFVHDKSFCQLLDISPKNAIFLSIFDSEFSLLRSGLCGYSDAYTIVKEAMTVANITALDQPNNAANKKVMFKIVCNLLIA